MAEEDATWRRPIRSQTLEHLGVGVGEDINDFSRVHRAALTGQQFLSPDVEPYHVLCEDFTHVQFYRRSLRRRG